MKISLNRSLLNILRCVDPHVRRTEEPGAISKHTRIVLAQSRPLGSFGVFEMRLELPSREIYGQPGFIGLQQACPYVRRCISSPRQNCRDDKKSPICRVAIVQVSSRICARPDLLTVFCRTPGETTMPDIILAFAF